MVFMPPPITIDQAMATARQHQRAGRFAEAEQLYRQILARVPGHVDALHLLGVVAHQVGRDEEAVALLQAAIARDPNLAAAHSNLSGVLARLGRMDEAATAAFRAIELKPDLAEAYANLAMILFQQDNFAQAGAAAERAVRINPKLADAQNVIGVLLREQGRPDEAIHIFKKIIAAHPEHAPAHSNLGYALLDLGNVDEAIVECKEAIALNPDLPAAHLTLGNAFKECGLMEEALAANARALKAEPGNAVIHSNRLYALHFHPGFDRRAIHEEHKNWNRLHAEPLKRFIEPRRNAPDPNRRLKIGYVSPDFCAHPVGRFMIAPLQHHDRRNFEVFCYADVRVSDSTTARLKSYAGVWRNISGVSHANLAELVREDGIDILIDLTLHMDNSRLLAFARKPAPVQVTYLAYCSTTGLETIDYRLTDPYLDPLEWDDSCYSERSVRLPRTYWCFEPHADSGGVAALPALREGRITFGCLNNFCKVSHTTLQTWARLLAGIPGSRLILQAQEGSHRQRVLDVLQREGIDASRVWFTPRIRPADYFRLYDWIDICLDPFPCAGGTTTCDAMWMGAPVVTLAGETAVGRAGVSLSSNVGLSHLVAQTTEEYVQKATALAKDLPVLSDLRIGLRDRMRRSPIMDGPRFAADIETAYRWMWRKWCENRFKAIAFDPLTPSPGTPGEGWGAGLLPTREKPPNPPPERESEGRKFKSDRPENR
jgi:predicted O-linked N-acetylglucosamine transferase (SPINDLY family)